MADITHDPAPKTPPRRRVSPRSISSGAPRALAQPRTAAPLVVVDRRPDDLRPNPRNARTHTHAQVRQVAASISQFGFVTAVAIDAEDVILCGHARVEAARLLKLETVPTVCLAHLSPAERRAYALADNKIAEDAGWDTDLLSLELGELEALELDFDVDVTGFGTFEREALLDPPRRKVRCDPADQVPESAGPQVTRPGDLWVLGEHRLLCGDARDGAAYGALMAGEQARMVFTDPPYNLAIDGVAAGRGRVARREFAMASGEMAPAEYLAFLLAALSAMASVCRDGAILFACIDWRSLGALLQAGEAASLTLKNLCVWAKPNAGLGSFYRSQHELVVVFKTGSAAHLNSFGMGGRAGRYRTNLWSYPGANTLRAGREDELALHPTVKPAAMVIDALKDVSCRGEIVLDPFGGSGTTLIAAEKSKRKARLIEIDPLYCDTICRRWAQLTGREPVLQATGQSFDEVAADRGAPAGGG